MTKTPVGFNENSPGGAEAAEGVEEKSLYYSSSSFARPAQMIQNLRALGIGIAPAKAQSRQVWREKVKILMKDFHRVLSDFCGLGAFAGDTPRLGCGSAALGTPWLRDKPPVIAAHKFRA